MTGAMTCRPGGIWTVGGGSSLSGSGVVVGGLGLGLRGVGSGGIGSGGGGGCRRSPVDFRPPAPGRLPALGLQAPGPQALDLWPRLSSSFRSVFARPLPLLDAKKPTESGVTTEPQMRSDKIPGRFD